MTNKGKNAFDTPPKVTSDPSLRQQAKEILQSRMGVVQHDATSKPLTPEATHEIVHDLRVHEIELEMQNEELRRTQVELESARARYFDLYDLAPVGYCTVSERGLILQANLAATTLLGVTRSALVNQPISKFILKADQDTFYLTRTQLMETQAPKVCELRMVKSNGTPFWAFLALTITHGDDGTPVLRMVLTDVTESKLTAAAMQESEACYRTLSEVLEDKNTELTGARLVAEKASRAKTDFLSNMSHELRTPLGAILGFAQLLESGATPPTPVQLQSIQQIIKAGWYLLELINEILDLAQIESGRLPLTMEATELTTVLNECRSMVGPQAQTNGVTVTCPACEKPAFVHADHKHLKQVIINLLSNAIKYNKVGGTVVVDTRERPTAKRVRLSVKDTGEGLSPEQIKQLFQPFNRLGRESGPVSGTGIGLTVCKRLVELMGGSIGVESTPGEGSVFWIELNLTQSRHAGITLAGNTAAAMQDVQRDTEAHTVLYVEDNLASLVLIEELFAQQPNIRLLSARTGTHGIEIARSAQPDVIFLDIDLPGINGFEAMRILHRDPLTARIPVLALSANATPDDIAKGIQAGFFGYVAKPINVDTFMKTLRIALNFSKSTATHTATTEHAS